MLCCQTTGGDGGGDGWSSPGPTDDHTPGPAVDREPENTHVHNLSDITVLAVCDITSCFHWVGPKLPAISVKTYEPGIQSETARPLQDEKTTAEVEE